MVEIDGIRYLTVDEVCLRLEVKPATIYAYVSRGIVRSYKQGMRRQRLYREDEIDALLTLRPSLANPPATIQSHAPEPAERLASPDADPGDRIPLAADWISNTSHEQISPHVREVEVVESSISTITAEGLFMRGVSVELLLEVASFEEASFILWHDRRPTRDELRTFREHYVRAWMLPGDLPPTLARLNPDADPLTALLLAMPLLASTDPEREDRSPAAERRRATRLLAQTAAVLACRHWGMPVARLDPGAPLAVQILRALGAKTVTPQVANAALILYADYGLPAATYAARIAAAAGASLYDGVTAALSVLRGPSHGGGLLNAASLLRHLVDSPQLSLAVDQRIATKQTLAEWSHHMSHADDTRATHFRRLAEQVVVGEARRWLEAAAMLEERMLRDYGQPAPADLFAAVFLHAIGIKDHAMLGVFAISRASGWLAHMLEQYANNRLVRPRARFTGTTRRSWEDLS